MAASLEMCETNEVPSCVAQMLHTQSWMRKNHTQVAKCKELDPL